MLTAAATAFHLGAAAMALCVRQGAPAPYTASEAATRQARSLAPSEQFDIERRQKPIPWSAMTSAERTRLADEKAKQIGAALDELQFAVMGGVNDFHRGDVPELKLSVGKNNTVSITSHGPPYSDDDDLE